MPPAEAYGVATFYAMFSVEPQPATVLHVCDDLACRIRGATPWRRAERTARRRMRRASRSGAEPLSRLVRAAPAVLFQGAGAESHVPHRGAGRRRITVLASRSRGRRGRSCRRPALAPRHGGERLLRRVGAVDPSVAATTTARTEATPRWHARIELGPDAVIREVNDAKLLGRGGAAFPTGVKWHAVADQPGGPIVRRATRTNPSPAPSRTACSWRAIRSR